MMAGYGCTDILVIKPQIRELLSIENCSFLHVNYYNSPKHIPLVKELRIPLAKELQMPLGKELPYVMS